MAIIQICQGQTELRITMNQAGCGGQLVDYQHLRMVITAPPEPEVTYTMFALYGCWPEAKGPPPPSPAECPVMVYPAFDLSEDGEIIFRFDDMLFRRPCGRYIGRIENTSNGHCLAELQLDLCSVPFIATRISVNDPTCQGGNP